MKRINGHFTMTVILVVVLLAASLSDSSVEAGFRAFGGFGGSRDWRPKPWRPSHGRTRFPQQGEPSPPPPPPNSPSPPPPNSPSPPPPKSPSPPPPKTPSPPPPLIQVPPPNLGTPGLRVGFYDTTACSNVEVTVKAAVEKEFNANPGIAALLLRMYFHDCFADGQCDASLLITQNKNPSVPTEQDSGANEGIRGLDFIDTIQDAVVAACKGNRDVVSCADIIALAVRDAVSLASDRAPYAVPTGRFDGKVSLQANADTLPGPRQAISSIVARFKLAGFSPEEVVTLSGAHTVGQARCEFFDDRLGGTGKPDPTMNTTTASRLRLTCTNTGPVSEQNRVFLDQGPNSQFVVDKSYYVMLTQGNGVLESDQQLAFDPLTKAFVGPLANGREDNFQTKFEQALIKMGNLGPLSSAKGDIRKKCSVLN